MRSYWLPVVALLFLSCQQNFDEPAPFAPPESGLEQAVSNPAMPHPALLPAYRQEWEKKVPGKADEFDDYRAIHPQYYAITEPPALDTFRPMNEWEPMQAMALTFSNGLIFDSKVSATLVDAVLGALEVGDVWVVTDGESARQTLTIKLKVEGVEDDTIADHVHFFDIPNNAFWFIDYGPLPLVDEASQTVAFADFKYYHYRVQDDAIPTRLGNLVGATTYRSPFPYEGGNFQADGEEYCYYGERVYSLTGMSAEQVNQLMQDYYGCQQAVVLKDITNDGTGHIDMFFKLGGKHVAFVGDYTVVNDPENKQRMDDNAEVLKAVVYSDGSEGITVYRIPMPNPSQGIPRTYINSTLFNGPGGKVNLWPMYTVDKDLEAEALQVWQEGLPDWEHVGIVSDQISALSGAVHCVTRTIPDLPMGKWVADGECVNGLCQGEEGAYDGSCLPQTVPTPGCWGPAWECLCNDCSTGCDIPASCGDGTCDAAENCFLCPQDCGCGEGEHCNMVLGTCDTCGDGVCGDGENCLDCPYDCGCGDNEACVFGVCTTVPCGGVPYEGCCDGDTLVYCGGGTLQFEQCGNQGCGWNDGLYGCGGNHSDPEGLPLECTAYDYPTGCGNKECGDNGGGYSCGECADGESCVEGTCEGTCEPQCDGLECGDDGCGGSCGECAESTVCDAGICIADEPQEDVISQPDSTVEPDVVPRQEVLPEEDLVQADTQPFHSEEEPGDETSDDGCTAGTNGNGAAALMLLALLLGLCVVRRARAELTAQ